MDFQILTLTEHMIRTMDAPPVVGPLQYVVVIALATKMALCVYTQTQAFSAVCLVAEW